MANFTRVKALGWALYDLLESALMNQLDTNVSKAVNGDDGSVHDGDVELGSLVTHRDVDSQGDVNADGDVTAVGDVIATSSLKGSVSMAEKVQPRSIYTVSVDCSVGSPTVALNLTLYDTFVVTLIEPSSVLLTAVLSSITFTTAAADTDHELKPGARFSITVKANAAQTGGCGMAVGAFPSSVKGLTASDELGCRYDANDSTTYVLEQVGTAGTPSFLCVGVFHGGA